MIYHNSYKGFLNGPDDYELWYINLEKDDDITINHTGISMEVDLLANNSIRQSSFGLDTLTYTIKESGKYGIQAINPDEVGSYEMKITVTKPANTGLYFDIITLCLLSAVVLFLKRKEKSE